MRALPFQQCGLRLNPKGVAIVANMSATSSPGPGFSPARQPWVRGSLGVLSLLLVLATRPYSILVSIARGFLVTWFVTN